MTGLRAIMVAVDYADLLKVTLPYNRHHFDEVHVVTDEKNVDQLHNGLVGDLNQQDGPPIYLWYTGLFYADGARFNKWRALEWGLDQMGRHGWICNMDADVLWPKAIQVAEFGRSLRFGWLGGDMLLHRGELMSPLRRMAPWPTPTVGGVWATEGPFPHESEWGQYPIHRNVGEWAGYSQVFHASDPALGTAPWHEIDWSHAGGADSIFQRKWSNEKKRRPAWQVLHLGEPGQNWYGRATPDVEGRVPEGAEEKQRLINAIWEGRRRVRANGGTEADTFQPERIQLSE